MTKLVSGVLTAVRSKEDGGFQPLGVQDHSIFDTRTLDGVETVTLPENKQISEMAENTFNTSLR